MHGGSSAEIIIGHGVTKKQKDALGVSIAFLISGIIVVGRDTSCTLFS
jgi:hypothetical protein